MSASIFLVLLSAVSEIVLPSKFDIPVEQRCLRKVELKQAELQFLVGANEFVTELSHS